MQAVSPSPFGVELRRLRKRERVGQRELARLSDLSATTIASLERRGGRPRLETVQCLAKGFATDPESGLVDEAKLLRVQYELAAAAGYVVVTRDPAGLRQALESIVREWEHAGVKVAISLTGEPLEPWHLDAIQRQIVATVDAARRDQHERRRRAT